MRHITPSALCYLELEVEVEYEYSPFVAGRLSGPPEDCYPDEPEELTISAVYIWKDLDEDHNPVKQAASLLACRLVLDISDYLSSSEIDQIESQVMDSIDAGQYDCHEDQDPREEEG